MIVVVVICIWGPLCLFALANVVGIANVPYSAALTIKIGSYNPLYQTSTEENVKTFDKTDLNKFETTFIGHRYATEFLSNYDEVDIAAIVWPSSSSSVWEISPPDTKRLISDLEQNKTLTLRLQYAFYRMGSKGDTGVINGGQLFEINNTFTGRNSFIRMLNGVSENNEFVEIPLILPKFLKLLNKGNLHELSVFSEMSGNQTMYRNLKLRLHPIPEERTNTTGGFWWEVVEDCSDKYYIDVLSNLPHIDCSDQITVFTFNDKKFPSHFDILTAGG